MRGTRPPLMSHDIPHLVNIIRYERKLRILVATLRTFHPHHEKKSNNVYLVPYKPGDLSSLPYKTVRYVLSSLWLSINCRMPTRPLSFMRIRINPNRRGFGVHPPDS